MNDDDGPRRPDRTRPVRATSRSDVESDVSLTVYALVEKRRSAHRVVRTAARSVARPTAASRRGNSGAPPRSLGGDVDRLDRVRGKRPHCGDAETICCVGRPFPRDRVIVTRVRTSRSEGFEYDNDDDDGVRARVRARLTEFDRYIPVFTGIHYGYDTRMIPTEDTTDPLLRPLTTLGTRRFEFFFHLSHITWKKSRGQTHTASGKHPADPPYR